MQKTTIPLITEESFREITDMAASAAKEQGVLPRDILPRAPGQPVIVFGSYNW